MLRCKTRAALVAAGALLGVPVAASAQAPPADTSSPATLPAPVVPAPVAPAPAPVVPPLPATAITVPPPVAPPPYLPFPSFPSAPMDEANNGWGIAQQTARAQGLQGRILWIDATANLDRVNTAEKIAALTAQIKAAGFNTIVFDVKPIIGYTLYPSKFAPKLTEWVRPWLTQSLPLAFDPLAEMVKQAHAQGLGLIVNLNAFSEGHREFKRGPGYDRSEWQTVLYEAQLHVRRDLVGVPPYPLSTRLNQPPRDPAELSLYTDLTKLKVDPAAMVAVIDNAGTVLAQVSGAGMAAVQPSLPPGGAALVGVGQAGLFLRQQALPGQKLVSESTAAYVPIGQRPETQVPLMVNPHHPEVRQRMLDIVAEVVRTYAVDGVVFDDRLRYASINADFSETTRREFEAYVGKPLTWPDDVFRYEYTFPGLERREIPGPYYDAWLVFRALTLRNWVAQAAATVKGIRPAATIGVYVGSWYPEYPDYGANWAADDFTAGYRFLNPSYQKTGFAGLIDFVIPGAYYTTATMQEAVASGLSIGATVEAAGQFANRAANNRAWVYAGISLEKFAGRPDALKRVLQAAASTTQGVMVFDLSHKIDLFWPVFAEAFQKPATAPHAVPGLLEQVRRQHAERRATGAQEPPVVLHRGISGTGF